MSSLPIRDAVKGGQHLRELIETIILPRHPSTPNSAENRLGPSLVDDIVRLGEIVLHCISWDAIFIPPDFKALASEPDFVSEEILCSFIKGGGQTMVTLRTRSGVSNRTYSLEEFLSWQSGETLREIFVEYAPDASSSWTPKLLMCRMIAARLCGGPFAFASRREEDLILGTSEMKEELRSLFIPLCGILVPKDIIQIILSFREYDYDLILSFGCACWSAYVAVLSTWPSLTIVSESLCFISKLVLRSTKEIIVSEFLASELTKSDWNLVVEECVSLEKLMLPSGLTASLLEVLRRRGPDELPFASRLRSVYVSNWDGRVDPDPMLSLVAPGLEVFKCEQQSVIPWLASFGSTPLLRLRKLHCRRLVPSSLLRTALEALPCLEEFGVLSMVKSPEEESWALSHTLSQISTLRKLTLSYYGQKKEVFLSWNPFLPPEHVSHLCLRFPHSCVPEMFVKYVNLLPSLEVLEIEANVGAESSEELSSSFDTSLIGFLGLWESLPWKRFILRSQFGIRRMEVNRSSKRVTLDVLFTDLRDSKLDHLWHVLRVLLSSPTMVLLLREFRLSAKCGGGAIVDQSELFRQVWSAFGSWQALTLRFPVVEWEYRVGLRSMQVTLTPMTSSEQE